MATKTKAQFIDEVLENLGVLAEGQTAEVEQVGRIDSRLQAIMETLRSDEVYYLGDIDNIELDAFAPLADVVAWECRSKFGVMGDDLVTLGNANTAARATLKRIRRNRPSYETLRTEYM